MVNIPDYSLNIQKDGKSALSMDVAVGGSDHPSCVLTSQISHVVIHPYWNMPTDIAATELWPQLRKDKNFLAKKTFCEIFLNEKGLPRSPKEIVKNFPFFRLFS
jgi:murein L,D-transpeptidase YcbB/YkuD